MIILVLLLLVAAGVIPGVITVWVRKRRAPQTNEAVKRADRQRLGVRYAEDGLFLIDDGMWTGVLLPGTSDDFASNAQQEEAFDRSANFYRQLLAYAEAEQGRAASIVCHELVRYQPVDTSRWEAELNRAVWDPSRLFKKLLANKVAPHVAEAAPEPRRILMVRLGTFKGPTMLDPITLILNSADHVAEEHFRSSDLEPFRDAAAKLHARLSLVGAEPISRADLVWLIRKPLYGNFQPPIESDYVSTRPWRAGFFDQVIDFEGRNLSDAVEVIEPSNDGGERRKSYVTTLVVADSPAVMPFDYHNAWGRVLRTLPYQVEVSWRFKLMSSDAWKKMAKRRIGFIKDEADDRVQAGKIDDAKFAEVYGDAVELDADLDVNPSPAMIGQLRLSISAPSRKELARAVQDVKAAIKDIELQQPLNIQHALLREQLPGDPDPIHVGKVNLCDYTLGIDLGTRWTDIEALALARLDSSPNVGDAVEVHRNGHVLGWRGPVIGYCVDNGAVVHFDPHVQVARNHGAGIGIIGASGGGKSSLALMLFFWMSESGTQVVAADPKNDIERFCYYIAFGAQVTDPEFEQHANRGILGTPQSRFQPINAEFWAETDIINLYGGPAGMLSAWALTDTYEAGEALARAQLELLIPERADRDKLEPGFQKLKEMYRKASASGETYIPSLSELASALGEEIELYQKAADASNNDWNSRLHAKQELVRMQALYARLDNAARAPYARLLFGGADATSGFRSIRKRRTVITLFQFTPPDPSKSPNQWSEKERDAAAAIFTALHRINDFFGDVHESVSPHTGRQGRRPRALFIDEAYIVTAMEAGRDLIARALRQGRSLNFVVVFISQQAKDIAAIERAMTDAAETDQNQFSTVFVFMQKGRAEAMAALELLRDTSDADDAERSELARRLLPSTKGGELGNGVCVMRDVDNRVSVVKVDQMFVELSNASETNATLMADAQSTPISDDGDDWTINPTTLEGVRSGVSRKAITAPDGDDHSFEFDGFDTLLTT
ncbi:ATP-binding protein [Rhodococcus sp. C26F]|uniref:ATP-binding protein n=1 Tax=Rhodococcus TaxID=1827 RepID=UPI000903995F|nr:MULTISPECIES: ATP-binding protein [Rhodococcus]APE12621.1 hypothetical protein BO226_25015 [Rhodococcus sp. 2G]UTM40206.1 ATP-binding protein [Rhodococcus pyridinivorans]